MIEDMGPAELEPEELEPLEAEPESPAADGSTVLEKLKEAAMRRHVVDCNAHASEDAHVRTDTQADATRAVLYTPETHTPPTHPTRRSSWIGAFAWSRRALHGTASLVTERLPAVCACARVCALRRCAVGASRHLYRTL